MTQRYLAVWLTLFVGIAAFWPPSIPFDPFLRTPTDFLIAVIMFTIGGLLSSSELADVARRWPRVLAGTAVQYCSMPLLAWGCGRLFQLSTEALIGVTIVGCVPGAMASNVLTLLARGNVSYSVSLTTLATLLSPLIVPFVLWLTLRQENIAMAPLDVSLHLILTVVGPVMVGHLLSRRYLRFRGTMARIGPTIAHLAIVWLIAVVVAKNRGRLDAIDDRLAAALLAINLGGYAAGYFFGKALGFGESYRRALTLEVGMQNAGLGVTIALRFFPNQPAAALPPALFAFGCMFTGTLLAYAWSWRPPDDAVPSETVRA